jgi:hypothetical protein
MKIKHLWNLLKEGSTQEEQFGKNLIASGWTIKINYYIPLIKIKNPEGKETEIDGNDADKILSKIKMGQDEKTWVLGYLHKTNALNEHTLNEGVYDKGILKAIFLIGGREVVNLTLSTNYSEFHPRPHFQGMVLN